MTTPTQPDPTPTPAPQTWHAQALALLDALTGPHAQKKRDTIIALVDAQMAGRKQESVWDLPQVCNRSVYWGKWRKDPEFVKAHKAVQDLASHWRNTRALAALQQASESLALATPAAVAQAIRKMNSMDENISLKAAFGILDRAGVETARKSSTETAVTLAPDIESMIAKVYGGTNDDDSADGDGDEGEGGDEGAEEA